MLINCSSRLRRSTAINSFTQSQSFENKLKNLNQASPGHEQAEKKEPSNKDQLPLSPHPVCWLGSAKSWQPIESCWHTKRIQTSRYFALKETWQRWLSVTHTHKQLGHTGRGHVLAKLHKRYWITKANSAVRQLISLCVTYQRIKSTPLDQKVAYLPEDRLTPTPPFTYAGVDYFGPYVTN